MDDRDTLTSWSAKHRPRPVFPRKSKQNSVDLHTLVHRLAVVCVVLPAATYGTIFMVGRPASGQLQRPLLLASSGVDIGTAVHVDPAQGGTTGPEAVSPRDVCNPGRASFHEAIT